MANLGYLETNIGLLQISTLIQRPSAQLIIYAYHSLVVLEPIRTKAADLVARANYGLSIGNFGMDMDDGELRFKVNCQIPPGGVSAHNVGLALDAALGSLAHYHTAFVRCLYDGLSPKEAIEELEAENLIGHREIQTNTHTIHIFLIRPSSLVKNSH